MGVKKVVSSKVERPASGAAGLAEVLSKAGVEGLSNGTEPNATEDLQSAKATVASSSKAPTTSPKPDASDPSDSDDGDSDIAGRLRSGI